MMKNAEDGEKLLLEAPNAQDTGRGIFFRRLLTERNALKRVNCPLVLLFSLSW